MSDVPDPYRVLGVRRAATLAEIKSAHRRLAKAHHPDAGGDGSRFLAIQAAYQLLADPAQRRHWDAAHAPGPVAPGDGYEPGRRGGPARRADGARERRTGPRRRPAGASREDARHAERPGPGEAESGRDPSQVSWTWSAAGVPWWEEGARSRAAGKGSAGSGSGSEDGAAGADTGSRASRRAPGGRHGAGDSPRPDDRGESARSPEPSPATATPGAGDGPHGIAGPDRGDPGMDVYNRSSGAAWSAASRAYFRKVAADMPRGARMGHSSWTGRVGWEPPAEEIARAAQRPARRRARPTRRPVPGAPAPTIGTSEPAVAAPDRGASRAAGARSAGAKDLSGARPVATPAFSMRRLADLAARALRR